MLNAAMVLMILAGILGLPAIMCSGFCAGLGLMTGADKGAPEGQAIMNFLFYMSVIASIGSIIMGALVKKNKKLTSGIACFVFAGIFVLLLIQGNIMGLVSSLMLIVAGVMIFVAPPEQFDNITKVKIT